MTGESERQIEERQVDWHFLSPEETARRLVTDTGRGLAKEEAARRLAEHGPNEIAGGGGARPIMLFLGQFNDFMIWVLMAAALVSGLVLRETVDALAIAAILLLNAILGFVQEYRAEAAMAALKDMSAPTATVIRDGTELEVPARELAVGDLILIAPGDRIPADARIVSAVSLRTDESTLTGESQPAGKSAGVLTRDDAPVGEAPGGAAQEPGQAPTTAQPALSLGDRGNMLFAGTVSVAGRGTALVTATGAGTEMGKIAELIEEPGERTPLQVELRRVGQRIAVLCLIVCAIVFAVGGFRILVGQQLVDQAGGNAYAILFLAAVSLAVAAIPEGLPAIVTVSLAMGVQAMARRRAIVRRLHAVETLGATTVICTDKTGTLTRNRMEVDRGWSGGVQFSFQGEAPGLPSLDAAHPDDLGMMLTVAALCNDARAAESGLVGDPTETALLEAADRGGFPWQAMREAFPRLTELPFEAERKQMTTVNDTDFGVLALVKGAPERVLDESVSVQEGGRVVPLDADRRDALMGLAAELAQDGYRTLALAFRHLDSPPAEPAADTLERELTLAGLLALEDPPRAEAAEAVKTCHDAGMRVVMVTGDHALTAWNIARRLGIVDPAAEGTAVTGADLEAMSDDELSERAATAAVYARTDPAHKLRLVESLKSRGEVVAMTGDGVNDAPALKRADIGIAMGITGTDVSKEASDMVLADDNFATIVGAVHRGRVIFDNITKAIHFLVSCNVSEVLTMFVALMVGLPLPLWPIQILWINLVTDGLPALALGVDPEEPDIMSRPPRNTSESILGGRHQSQIVIQGALLTTGALGAFVFALFVLRMDTDAARTVLFSTMVLAQVLHALNFRSRATSVFSTETFANRALLGAVAGSIALQLAAVYAPGIRDVFRSVPLGLPGLLAVVAFAVLPLLAVDWLKVRRATA